jgi:hypothetical protein
MVRVLDLLFQGEDSDRVTIYQLICLFCVREGLTSLIKKYEGREYIHGVKVCQGSPCLSQLLYSNLCFIVFFKADAREAQCMKNIMNDYEKASSQAINYAKSEVYFSRNTSIQLTTN